MSRYQLPMKVVLAVAVTLGLITCLPASAQTPPPDMLAGLNRMFNRLTLEVLDGPLNSDLKVGDPISSVTGEFVESVVDFDVDAIGPDFGMERSWRSMATYKGPFGLGWDSPIHERVVAQVDPVTDKLTGLQFFDGNGRADFFYRWDLIPNDPPQDQTLPTVLLRDSHSINAQVAPFQDATAGDIQDPPEYFYAEKSTGINEVFELVDNRLYRLVPGRFIVEYELCLRLDQLDQSQNLPGLNLRINQEWGAVQAVTPISVLGQANPSGDDIRPIDLNERYFRVAKRTDLYGNFHEFQYIATHPDDVALVTDQLSAITNNKGESLGFTYYGAQDPYPGGIATVTHEGRVVTYVYDVDGNMVEVVRLGGTSEERKTLYGYGSVASGYSPLITVENPNEAADPIIRKPAIRNRYVGRRVIQQEWGAEAITPSMAGDPGNSGEPCFSLKYTYYPSSLSRPIPPLGAIELPRVETLEFTRRDGSLVTYYFQPTGEAAGYSILEGGRLFHWLYEWENGKLVRITDPSPDPSIPAYCGKVQEFVYNFDADDPRDRGQLIEKTIFPEINGAAGRGEVPHVWTYEDYDSKWQEPGKLTDPEGVVHTTTRTEIGPPSAPTGYLISLTSVAGSDAVESSREFDQFGREVKTTDTLGKSKLTYYQPDSERISEVQVDAGGSTTILARFSYDALGRLATSTDSTGVTVQYYYNSYDERIRTVDADGIQTYVTYDKNGQKAASTVRSTTGVDLVEEYTLDILGNVVSTRVDRTGNGDYLVTTTEYDANGRIVATVDPTGLRSEYVWGLRDQLKQVRHGANTSNPIVTGLDYNHAGALVSTTNHLGYVWTRVYDKHMRLVETIDPVGTKKLRKMSKTRETEVRWQDSLGVDHRWTKSTHDGLGRLVLEEKLAKVAPGGADIGDGWLTMTYTVNAAGEAIAQTDELGATTSFVRDRLNRVVEATDSLGNKTQYNYLGDFSKITGVTEQLVRSDNPGVIVRSRSMSNSYDASHRISSTTDFSGATTTYEYDAWGRVVRTTDALGNVSESDLDLLGNVLKSRLWENQNGTLVLLEETQNEYDQFGRLWKKIDGEGRVTIFEFDDFSRVTTKTLHDGSEFQWTYDSTGRIATFSQPGGTIFSYTFDPLDRLLTVAKVAGTGIVGDTGSTIYTYEPFGQVASAADGDSFVASSYTTLGTLSSETQHVNGAPGRTFTGSFGAIGERTSVDYPDFGPGAYRVEYDYDSKSRLAIQRAGFAGSLAQVRSHVYEGASRIVETGFGSGLSRQAILDDADFVLSRSYRNGLGNGIFSEERLSDDLSREIWRRIDYLDNGVSYYDRVTHNDYDGADRLETFHKDVTVPIWSSVTPTSQPLTFGDDEQFSWSPAGMRTAVARGVAGNDSLTYNSVHDLTASSIAGALRSYQVDARGSRTYETTPAGAISYAYDVNGRLAHVVFENGDSIDYCYDVAGRRIQEVVTNGSGVVARRFYHDGMTKAVEVEVLDGPSGVNEAPYAYNVFAEVAGSPVMTHRQNATGTWVDAYPLTDSRGNVVVLVDSVGVPLQHVRYDDEFGRVTWHAGSLAAPVARGALPMDFPYSWGGLRVENAPSSSDSLLYEAGSRVWDALAGSYLQRNPWAPEHGKADNPSAAQDFLQGRFSYPGPGPESPFYPPNNGGGDDSDWVRCGPGTGPGPGSGPGGGTTPPGGGGPKPGSPIGGGERKYEHTDPKGPDNGGAAPPAKGSDADGGRGGRGGSKGHKSSGGGNRQNGGDGSRERKGRSTRNVSSLEERIADLQARLIEDFFEKYPDWQGVPYIVQITVNADGGLHGEVLAVRTREVGGEGSGCPITISADDVLDLLQGGIAIVGMVPEIGDIADVVNGGITFVRTLADGGGVGESFAAATRDIGLGLLPMGIGAADKVNDAFKVADRVGDTLKAADKLADAAKATDNVADAGEGGRRGYRAVSDGELTDIAENGFRPHPEGRSLDEKWFANTRSGAEQHRRNFPDNRNIVEVEVPADVRVYEDPNIDQFGGFSVSPADQPRIRRVGGGN